MTEEVSNEKFQEIYSQAWEDAMLTIQLAARNGTLIERFLDGEIPKGLIADPYAYEPSGMDEFVASDDGMPEK